MFYFDNLTWLMIGLVCFIGSCVASFATRYLKGDSQYQRFFLSLLGLIISIILMVSSNHLLLLLTAWCLSNIFLIRLMVHRSSWKAAKASGFLTGKTALLGASAMLLSVACFYLETGETEIQQLIAHESDSNLMLLGLICLLIAAMCQSAIWPFHRWLISSLNSPTPVSAIMHAGLINGGGFLLARFAPLTLQHSVLMNLIFTIGMLTAVVGTLWKLIQPDVKRMLACSTMGQMGFMFAQCGLGLFPLAVTHLIWHGMFKAYLFLNSGSAAQEKKLKLQSRMTPGQCLCALFFGSLFCFYYMAIADKTWQTLDTNWVILTVVFLSGVQMTLPVLKVINIERIVDSFLLAGSLGIIYGLNVKCMIWLLGDSVMYQALPLNAFHLIGMMILISTWLASFYIKQYQDKKEVPEWMIKGYVQALNASQPQPDTITAIRNEYKYR